MSDYIPLNRLELIVLLLVVFCVGLSAGIFIGALPHPRLGQRNLSTALMLFGSGVFIVFSIHRSNKEWKIKTAHQTAPTVG